MGRGAGAVLGWLTVMLMAAAALRAEEWSGRMLLLEAEDGTARPPVVSAVALHPLGKVVAIAGDDHRVRILDLKTGKVLQRWAAHGDWVRALAYAPSGKLLASAGNDGRILVWDASSGRVVTELAKLNQTITAIAFSRDGGLLASIGFDDDLHVFDVSGRRQIRQLKCPCHDMRALAYSSNMSLLASAGRNGIVRLWDAEKGQVLQEITAHRQRVWGLAFSPDNQCVASCAEDGLIRVTRLDGQGDFTLESPGTKVMSLAFCGPDRLATGGSDNLIRIWDLKQRVKIAELAGHTGSVVSLAYGGNVLISAGYDTTVRVWATDGELAKEPAAAQDRVGSRWEPRPK